MEDLRIQPEKFGDPDLPFGESSQIFAPFWRSYLQRRTTFLTAYPKFL